MVSKAIEIATAKVYKVMHMTIQQGQELFYSQLFRERKSSLADIDLRYKWLLHVVPLELAAVMFWTRRPSATYIISTCPRPQ
jgi:hypothetical protein